MKLDNIIYDVDSLRTAIAEQWSLDSEVFASIYPSDTATALINGMAAYGSMLQYCIVSALANCYTTTAFSDAAIYQLADTLGNDLHGNVSSQVVVNMTKNNFKGINTTIPAYSTFTIKGKLFFNPYAIIIPATTDTVKNITLVQGEIIEVNKTTSGIENEKFYFSSEFKASPNYIRVFVNDEEWNVVDSFLQYDKSYVLDIEDMNSVILKTDPDGRAYVKVGNGQLGTLPLSGSIIQIKYCSNDGIDGNIDEKDLEGSLSSQLMYVDNKGNQDTLDLTIYTTTTAFGGFSKQSVETLRLTSPWVFASGHRAIRRQDYNAMLQNKCGYITSAVWGEYEQANKIGTYDSIMMNMVYYTGIKSFETYPYFKLDVLTDLDHYNGALFSNSGFYGSYNIRVTPVFGSGKDIVAQDTGAQGILFINDNNQDPRDSLLPDWIAGNVIVGTNDVGDEEPISNAMSNKENIPYRSDATPTLQNPVQIYINFPEEKGLAGIKFRAYKPGSSVSDYPFIGTMAMFGANGDVPPSYENVRNSNEWVSIIGRKEFSTPLGNENDSWTDWVATNCFTGKTDNDSKPIFNKYKYYVIEIYSKESTTEQDACVSFDCIKLLYEEDASELYYNENSKIQLKLPVGGTEPSPGPGIPEGYLPEDFKLIGNQDFYMYYYGITLDGITEGNGYKDDDILIYKSTGNSIFKVVVKSVANNEYEYSVDGRSILTGNEKVSMTTGQPLNINKVYTYTLDPSTNRPETENMGEGYSVNDIITILDENNQPTDLKLRVAAVNTVGGVLVLTWLDDELINTELDKVVGYTYSNTSSSGAGTGLKLKVVSKAGSQGSGGTILITSTNNLEIDASFKGNRIDTADVNYYDEPIIKQFNHFTTYLEFVQPEMHEVKIHAQVAIQKNAPIASGIVIQNIKTNIQKLFEITPDYMGKDLKLSDIYKAITDTEYVSWCKVLTPLDNQNININEIMICQDIIIDEVIDTYE